MVNKLKNKYFSENVIAFDVFLVLVTSVFAFIMVAYTDMRSLTIWSTNVWDVIYDGNIFNLYEYTAKNIYHAPHQYMGSELLSVLPWSIWNLPIWIAQRFFGVEILKSVASIAWSKLFLVAMLSVLLRFTYKISMILTSSNETMSRWAMILTAGSLYTFLSIYIAGQNDILMVTASVIAIYYLLVGKTKSFYLWSAFAIAIKPFYLIAYFVIILLIEKNFVKIAIKTVVGVSGIIVQKLLFMNAPMYKESMANGPTDDMIAGFFPGNLSTAYGPISFFMVALVLICLYAYFTDIRAKTPKFSKYIIYFVALTYVVYTIFSNWAYYRIFLIVPFIYLIMVQNNKIFQFNMLFDLIMSVGITLNVILRGSPVFRVRDTNASIMRAILGYRVEPSTLSYISVGDIFASMDRFKTMNFVSVCRPIASGLAVIGAILILVLNHPEDKIKLPDFNQKSHHRLFFWMRSIITVPFFVVVLLLFMGATGRI